MHRSRLAGFIIDCARDGPDLDQATRFWSQALGYDQTPLADPAEAGYWALDSTRDGLHIELQGVDHPSRVHLDIETDDIEAEVGRLESLGARRVRKVRTWWVMEAPTGHRFCVVKPQRADFADVANVWES